VADFDWASLLPIGVLLFGATVLGFTRRRAGRSLARREYPKLAERLGLRYHAPSHRGEVGSLGGTLEGMRVRVESDERARLVVYPPGDVGLDVRNYAHHKRTPADYQPVSIGTRADDRWAQNRFAREGRDVEAALAQLRKLIVALGGDRDRLRTFSVDAEKVECVFDFGVPPYLPASVVTRVLPAMVGLSRCACSQQTSNPSAAE
jgi:hypothetical protein